MLPRRLTIRLRMPSGAEVAYSGDLWPHENVFNTQKAKTIEQANEHAEWRNGCKRNKPNLEKWVEFVTRHYKQAIPAA